MSSDAEDYSKMKVIELKKLLKEKGLPLGGTKDELIERLKSANEAEKLLDETPGNAAASIDEDLEREIMAEGEKVTSSSGQAKGKKTAAEKRKLENGKEPKTPAKAKEAAKADDETPAKKVVKLSASPQVSESKLEARAKKFGMSNSNEEAKKEIRAKRFSSDTPAPGTPTDEALKKRAERFGITTATPEIGGEADEKKKKRAERFGITTGADTPKKPYTPIVIDGNKKVSMASPILSQTAQERKALRANRFKS